MPNGPREHEIRDVLKVKMAKRTIKISYVLKLIAIKK